MRTRRATSRPAASSWRSALPTPITTTAGCAAILAGVRAAARSATIDGQLQEVGGAGDAGIVVADRLLAAQRQLLVGQVEAVFDDRPQILLDGELVLGGGWHDRGVEDRAVVVDLIAVVQQATGRLGGAVPDRASRRDLDRGRIRLLVARDDRERVVACLHELDRAHDDALKRVAADRPQTGLARGVAGQRTQLCRGQRVARERPRQICAALADARVQRVGVLDVLLDDVRVELGRGDVQAAVGEDAAAVDG